MENLQNSLEKSEIHTDVNAMEAELTYNLSPEGIPGKGEYKCICSIKCTFNVFYIS